jgi:hypothetical protein
VLLLGPIGVLTFGGLDLSTHWSEASAASSGSAPTPQEEPDAVVQIYGARAYNWRGAFGIHTWIATKRPNAGRYVVYQVIGWNLYRGRSTVTASRVERPDFHWFNASPELLAEHRGPNTDALIDQIEIAVRSYPYPNNYRVWPGPNSNSFTAYVAPQVPELRLDLPPTAIGKDYLAGGKVLDTTPSGSGCQVSLIGLLGLGLRGKKGSRSTFLVCQQESISTIWPCACLASVVCLLGRGGNAEPAISEGRSLAHIPKHIHMSTRRESVCRPRE